MSTINRISASLAKPALAASLCALGLSACGGGSSGSSASALAAEAARPAAAVAQKEGAQQLMAFRMPIAPPFHGGPVTIPVEPGAGRRPAGNTGTGFYVAGGKLYDPADRLFVPRGVNHAHWDQTGGITGVPLSGANTERMALNFTRPAASNLALAQKASAAGVVPIPGNWGGTCSSDPAKLSAIVDTWVAQADSWRQLNGTGMVNIANEWGPGATTQQQVKPWGKIPNYVWRDSYVKAIARMRAAGYLGTLVVDAGGCGQDAQDVVQYGAAVLASDPQKNILFDVHVYGGFAYPAKASWQQDFATQMAALAKSGLPIMVGEFGPGKGIGPSPTMITPQTVVATAEAAGWGWLVWAWDDNDLAGCQTSDNWFGMTRKCGNYTGSPGELTLFGQTMVPIIKQLAKPATFKPLDPAI